MTENPTPAANGTPPRPRTRKPAAPPPAGNDTPAAEAVSELEALARRLEALQAEAQTLGEPTVVKCIGYGIKSARWADKQRRARQRRVGALVAKMQADGLTPDEIVARLTR